MTDEERELLGEQLTLWKNLRHDLERARMLVELVRKREKLKREQLRYQHMISDLQLRPLTVVMKRILDRLGRKDPADIFADPVSVDEVRVSVRDSEEMVYIFGRLGLSVDGFSVGLFGLFVWLWCVGQVIRNVVVALEYF